MSPLGKVPTQLPSGLLVSLRDLFSGPCSSLYALSLGHRIKSQFPVAPHTDDTQLCLSIVIQSGISDPLSGWPIAA